MSKIRVRQAAELLRVSDDTVCRWIDDGTLTAEQDDSGRKVLGGAQPARFARDVHRGGGPQDPLAIGSSARLVTEVRSDPVMSQVQMQCAQFTVVSL